MFKKIGKLQKMVNSLLGLCADSRADEVFGDLRQTPEDTKRERLGVLILKIQDGVLEERDLRRMEKWLSSDPQTLRYYVDFQFLTAALYFHFNPERFSKNPISEHLFATP